MRSAPPMRLSPTRDADRRRRIRRRAAPSTARVGTGEAVRIFTGAPMPDGADAIVIQEDVRREGDRIAHRRPRRAGRQSARRRARLPRRRGAAPRRAAASPRATSRSPPPANHAELRSGGAPRVAILATGDELVAARRDAGPVADRRLQQFRRRRDRRGAAAASRSISASPSTRWPRSTPRSGGRATASADVLVTLGGASVGDHDLVQKALVAAGMELGFWRIAMRPGKPLMHGRLGAMRVLGLPGNPTSSVGLRHPLPAPAAARAARRARRGRRPEPRRRASAPTSPPTARGRTICAPRCGLDGGGILVATPSANQDSSLVKTMARADGLIVRPPRAEPAARGRGLPDHLLRGAWNLRTG